MRLAATADVHLDESASAAGVKILGPEGRSIRAADRERCLAACVEGAIAHDVDALIIAGDLFERNKPTPSEYVCAQRWLDQAAGRFPVVVLADNHGLSEDANEQHGVAPLAGRHPNLHVYLRPGLDRIETRAGVLQVVALPWPLRSTLANQAELRPLGPEEINALIADRLAALVAGYRQQIDPRLAAVLVGHVLVREAVVEGGQTLKPGGILVPAAALGGFDASILGDVHRAQRFGDGRVFYCGSLDRTDFGEEQDAKSWRIVDLVRHTAGATLVHEDIPSPARRFRTLGPEELTADALETAQRESGDLATCPITRVKGRVSVAAYDQLQAVLAPWRLLPTFSESLEVIREARVRSEAMRRELTEEEALREWCGANNHLTELPAMLAEHARLAGNGT